MDIAPDLTHGKFAFGEFLFDPRSGELRDGGKTALLRPQVAKLLTLLLEHAGDIVSREEIRQCLWGTRTVVEFEEGISACMRQLRVALNDGATGTRYIQTISRRGYKFIFPVSRITGEAGVFQNQGAIAVLPTTPPSAHVPRRRWRWLAAGAAIVLVLIAAAALSVAHYRYRVQFFTRTAVPVVPHAVIAVLPFTNLSTNPANDILGASVASELIDLLGPIAPDRLGVIADTSSMNYAGARKTIKTIGQDLGANFVLEGSITQNPAFIQVSARLIRVADQSYVWGSEYRLEPKYTSNTFQQTVVQIATHVALLLAPDASVKPLEFTGNRQAALDYQLGRYVLLQGDNAKAGDYCRQAMTLDPNFAAAYVCTAQSLLALNTLSTQQVNDASALVIKALELNADSSDAHLLQGTLDLFYRWNPTAATPQIREALRHNPGNAWAWQAQAAYYSAMDRTQDMRQAMAIAQSLDPVSMRISLDSAVLFYIDRQFDIASQYAQTAIGIKPDNELARHLLVLTLLGEGHYTEAGQQAALEMQYAGASPADISRVRAGRPQALVDYFNWYVTALATRAPDKLTAVFLADAYMHLGRSQQALKTLSDAVHTREVSILIPFMSVWPGLRPLCRETAFVLLTRQLGQPGCAPAK
ncbi:MAG: winged helix-turn-helix domain-containing protein [Gammaproteobacteria bacterium]|nr:winged helix-turn-helix domain-containing protein [Gammaproteobacteria bacterium]